MAIRTVLRMGDARLLQRAVPVSDFASLPDLLVDMRDTMKAQGGVGLAAPQIGVNLRVVIFEVEANPRYPDAEYADDKKPDCADFHIRTEIIAGTQQQPYGQHGGDETVNRQDYRQRRLGKKKQRAETCVR